MGSRIHCQTQHRYDPLSYPPDVSLGVATNGPPPHTSPPPSTTSHFLPPHPPPQFYLPNFTSSILPSQFITAELAQAVVDAGAVPLLVLCIQEPEVSLKRVSASALSDICKHSPEVRGREEGGG